MYIQKRSSHGRGEYEVAGTVNGLNATSLSEKALMIDTQSGLGVLSTGITLKIQGGKPRLRLQDPIGIHIQRWIEALLLMPKSIREEGQLLGGQPVIIAERYVMSKVHVTSAKIVGGKAYLQLGGIECTNDSGTDEISFPDRIKQILRIQAQADELSEGTRKALLAHRDEITKNRSIKKSTEKLVARVIEATIDAASDSETVPIPGEDPIPLLLQMLSSRPKVDIPPLEQIDPQDIEIRRRVADRWRLQKDRGPHAAQFRRAVRRAYDSTCLFCGMRLPSSDNVRMPGVDAAHIVPWAHYDADIIGNGLCLCKFHHWTFDQYLLALKYTDKRGYEVVVTSIAREAFALDKAVLRLLESVAGELSVARLPVNPKERPHPNLLCQLYHDVGVDI